MFSYEVLNSFNDLEMMVYTYVMEHKQVFASEMMGKGVGIIPKDGKVYAPCNGTAEAVFPTGHAIGLKDENGIEMLIHIGLDTVKLEGKGFTPHIKQGDTVKQGDLLVEFDKEFIEKEGYDSTIVFILTDMTRLGALEKRTGKTADVLETIMVAENQEA